MGNFDAKDLVLAENESVVKAWTYATGKKKVRTTHELIVTNKRIVSLERMERRDGQKITSEEWRNKDVVGVSCSAGTSYSRRVSILCGIAALLCFVGFCAMVGADVLTGLLMLAAAGGLGYLCYRFWNGMKSCTFDLLLTTQTRLNSGLAINKQSTSTLFGRAFGGKFFKRLTNKLKVKVEENAAYEIVAVIGSLLLTND